MLDFLEAFELIDPAVVLDADRAPRRRAKLSKGQLVSAAFSNGYKVCGVVTSEPFGQGDMPLVVGDFYEVCRIDETMRPESWTKQITPTQVLIHENNDFTKEPGDRPPEWVLTDAAATHIFWQASDEWVDLQDHPADRLPTHFNYLGYGGAWPVLDSVCAVMGWPAPFLWARQAPWNLAVEAPGEFLADFGFSQDATADAIEAYRELIQSYGGVLHSIVPENRRWMRWLITADDPTQAHAAFLRLHRDLGLPLGLGEARIRGDLVEAPSRATKDDDMIVLELGGDDDIALADLEDYLMDHLDGVGDVDGNGVGPDVAEIFITSDDPAACRRRLREVIADWPFPTTATIR